MFCGETQSHDPPIVAIKSKTPALEERYDNLCLRYIPVGGGSVGNGKYMPSYIKISRSNRLQ